MTKNVRFAFIQKETAVLAGQQCASSPSTASAAWSCPTFCRTWAKRADDIA